MRTMIDSLTDLATTLAPLISPAAPATIEVAKKAIAVINAADDMLGGDQLTEARQALEQRVNAHVDETVGTLRGNADTREMLP